MLKAPVSDSANRWANRWASGSVRWRAEFPADERDTLRAERDSLRAGATPCGRSRSATIFSHS